MKTHIIIKFAIALFVIQLLAYSNALGQNVPYINSLSERSTTAGEQITISGINFSATASNWLVTFGAQSVIADESSTTLIKVTVPTGATTDNISVTNLSNGLMAYSNEVFYISYGGAEDSFMKNKISSLDSTITNGKAAVDLCLCDFNKDGKNDMVVTHAESTFISVFTNQSTIGNIKIEHEKTNPEEKIQLGYKTGNIACADMNGDQYPDMIIASPDPTTGDRLIVIQNSANGTISFEDPIIIDIPIVNVRRNPGTVKIHDIDLDGKPDVIMAMRSEGTVDIYKNTSSVAGTITLNNTPQKFTVNGADVLFGLDVKDLNNDGLPDIGVSQDGGDDFFVMQNISQPGAINFNPSQRFEVNGAMRHLKFGDFDQDGFHDVAIVDITSNSNLGNLHILKNVTTGNSQDIVFDTFAELINGVGFTPSGIDVGDIEGDGDLDVILSTNNTDTDESLFIVENNGSFDGNLFESQPIELDMLKSNSRNVKFGDIDGDGRPDFVFTHKTSITSNSELGILLNQNCITPQITPSTNFAICAGQEVTFEATKSALELDYIWSADATIVQTGSNDTFSTTTAGVTYSVIINEPGCSNTSNAVTVTLDPDAFPNPIIDPVGVICTNTDLTFATSKNGTPDNVSFNWSGPNDFTSSEQNPSILPVNSTHAGEYTVVMTSDDRGCISDPVTVSVEIINVPVVSIINTDGEIFCNDGSSIDLSASDLSNKGNYAYTWLLDGSPVVPPQTGITFNTSTPGSYSVMVTDTSNCSLSSLSEVIQQVTPPTVSFESDDSKCIDSEIEFSATSTGDIQLLNSWDFGSDSTNQGNKVIYAYTEAGNYTASLNSTYIDVSNDNCAYEAITKVIPVEAPPTGAATQLIRSINEDPLNFEKCPSGALRVLLDNGPYDSIFWKIESDNYQKRDQNPFNESTFRLETEERVFATVKSIIGCTFNTDTVAITNFQESGVFINSSSIIEDSTSSNDISYGKIIHMSPEQISVGLSASNGTSPSWSPGNIFSDSLLTAVEAFPVNLFEKIYLTATDPNDCIETDSLTLITPPLRVDKNFSPNGDGINDCWEVTNARGNSCEVTIFDSKGRNIKQISSTSGELINDSCVWDGTSNGNSQAPAGVYYYVLKCTGENAVNKGGTILLAR